MHLRLSHLALFVGLSLSAAAQSVLSFAPTTLPEDTLSDATLRLISVPGFNSALGTLTQVKLTFSSSVYQGIFAQNGTALSQGFTATNSVGLTLKDAGNQTLAQLTNLQTEAGTLAAAAIFSAEITTPLSAVVFDAAFVNYLDVAAVNFTVVGQQAGNWSGPGGIQAFDAAGNAVLGVEYTFTPIPEPTFFAAVLGFALLGLLVRHAQRSAPAGTLAAS